MITIEANASAAIVKLQTANQAVKNRIATAVYTSTQMLRNRILQKLNGEVLQKRSGALARSIRDKVQTSLQGVIGIVGTGGVPYARIQNYGGKTAAHVIEAKAGGVLAFQMGGKTVFARRVNHPGSNIPARNYMESSLDDLRAEIIANITGAAHEGAA